MLTYFFLQFSLLLKNENKRKILTFYPITLRYSTENRKKDVDLLTFYHNSREYSTGNRKNIDILSQFSLKQD